MLRQTDRLRDRRTGNNRNAAYENGCIIIVLSTLAQSPKVTETGHREYNHVSLTNTATW